MVVGDRRHTRHSLPLPWYVQVKMVVLPSFADGGWTRDLHLSAIARCISLVPHARWYKPAQHNLSDRIVRKTCRGGEQVRRHS